MVEGCFVDYLVQVAAESQRKTLEEKFSGNVDESAGSGDVSQWSEQTVTATHTKDTRDCNKKNRQTKNYQPIAPIKMMSAVIHSKVEFSHD